MRRSHALAVALPVTLPVTLAMTLAVGLPSRTARADAVSVSVSAADGTATRARHALDAARAKHADATLACLEPKVFRAVVIAHRTYELGAALAVADVAERARLQGALEAIAARRAALQTEIDACLGIVPVLLPKTTVTVIIDAAIARPAPDSFESWAMNEAIFPGAISPR